MLETNQKPRLFISYAHKDAANFTRRMAYALSLLADVFWDIYLQEGDFSEHLRQEIIDCDFFISVMSPYSQPDGCWCRRELKIALQHGKPIIPVRFIETHQDQELEEKYNYADFCEDFEKGFRRLTFFVLKESFSSWEYLGYERKHDVLLEALAKGLLPGLIAKEIVDWVLVDRFWPTIRAFIFKNSGNFVDFGDPRTPAGLWEECHVIAHQLTINRDFLSLQGVNDAKEVLTLYFEKLYHVSDTNNLLVGSSASEVLEKAKAFIERIYIMQRNFRILFTVQQRFTFDTAEKLRELVIIHSRRSRYLY